MNPAMGRDNARCNSGRTSRNKGSLEVFGGAPRLLQAGVFDHVVTEAPPFHEEKLNPSASSLFESMMINSKGSSSINASRSQSSRLNVAQVERSLSQRALVMEERGIRHQDAAEWDAVQDIRRYSLEEGKADHIYSGYSNQAAGGANCIPAEVQRALSTFQQTFLVTDATQPDCPIMFASACFLAMTGYSHSEVIGRNCRFLQGPDTDRSEVARIRDALRSERNYSGRLLNYKKNGSPFWNLLTITPIRDAHDRVIMCVGLVFVIPTACSIPQHRIDRIGSNSGMGNLRQDAGGGE